MRTSTVHVILSLLATSSLTAVGCTTPVSQVSSASRADLAESTAAAPSSKPAPRPVVIQPRRGTVRLARGVHPLARPELEEGRVDPEKSIAHLSLFFALSPEQRTDRDALVAAQLDPKSPEYHHWLTPESYRARFGAKPEDIARVTAWLTEQGFVVHRASRLGSRVTFGAKVKDLEAAFQTEMHRYRVGQELHYAMATAPALPVELASSVLAVYNTHDFFPKPASHRTNSGAFASRQPVHGHYELDYDGGPDGGFQVLGPPDWAAAYDVSRLYSPGIGGKNLDGTGVTIGIVGTAEVAQSDIDAFRTTFKLPARTVTMTLVPDTGPAAGGTYGGGIEAILDLEWSGGIARGANVQYVFVGEDDYNVDDATFYLIEENLTPLVSESYGGCEAGTLPSDADVTEVNGTAANLMGITYMASAGDDGAADCVEEGLSGLYVDMPGSFPGVTSVGGTQFPSPGWNSAGNLESYPTLEEVWNESNNPYAVFMGQSVGVGAGGGGISAVFQRPAYQASVASCDPDGTLPVITGMPMRQVPDVALSAASGTPGYFIECTFDQATEDCSAKGGMPFGTPIGGTSASSPSFAGVVAILNQAVGERLGNINPMLYDLKQAALTSSPFHDVVAGNNEVVCGALGAGDAGGPDGGVWPDAGCGVDGLYGYTAIPGYDCASGLGSIDGYNLVSAWLGGVKTETTLVPSPTHTTEGGEVTLTATVDVDGANANPVAGLVTFAFESFNAAGKPDLSWELGTTSIGSGTVSEGVATLVTTVPPGLVRPGHQTVNVVALYGGDEHHLASTSAPATLTFAPLDFAIVPSTVTVAINAMESFTTMGGVSPVRWYIDIDTTQGFTENGPVGSSLDETSGAFVAGPSSGYVEISALDHDGVEALAKIIVGDPTTPAPWDFDAGAPDAGEDAAIHDAGTDAHDAAPRIRDAGRDVVTSADDAGDEGHPAGGGCACTTAGGASEGGSSPWGALGGFALAAGAALRRRRRAGA